MIAQTNPSPETQPEQPIPRPIEKWAALEGRWQFAPAESRYLGPSKPESTIPYGIAFGSIPFRDGSKSSGEMPFDIRGYRAIFYDDTIGGKKAVERSLEQHLRAVLGSATARGQLTQR